MRTRQPTRLHIILALLAALTLATYHPLTAQILPVWGGLEPGPHYVGYRVLYELDRSRIWRAAPDSNHSQETARPIRISVWYPADVSSDRTTMTLAEFVRDSAPSEYFAQLNRLLERRFVEIFSGVSQELYDTLLTLPLAAVKNAAPSAGSYPLVMYSPGGQASFPDNGVLSAYLASHGYVVASVPQLESTLEGVFEGLFAPDGSSNTRHRVCCWGNARLSRGRPTQTCGYRLQPGRISRSTSRATQSQCWCTRGSRPIIRLCKEHPSVSRLTII